MLLLANGVYKPDATDASALVIGKNITIAAQQTGQAVLDGQGKRRVLEITNGHVLLKGLNITNGYTEDVSSQFKLFQIFSHPCPV